MPYASGFFCGILVIAKFWTRTARTNERIANSIRARAHRLSERGYGELPIEAVFSVLNKTLEKILRKYKLTLPTLINQTVYLFSFIFFVEAFLFSLSPRAPNRDWGDPSRQPSLASYSPC